MFFILIEFFLYWYIYDVIVGIVLEIMVWMYDIIVDNYNFNFGEKFYLLRFFLFVCECNLV